MPSKLENLAKWGHSIPFSPSAQTAFNLEKTVICTKCWRPQFVYAKAIFQEMFSDQWKSDDSILNKVFTRENLSCNSMTELPYYTCKIFKNIFVCCGKASRLITSTENYPKCDRCSKKSHLKSQKEKNRRKWPAKKEEEMNFMKKPFQFVFYISRNKNRLQEEILLPWVLYFT